MKNKAVKPKEMTLEELRKSPNRAVWVDGKGWDDRWAAKQFGQEHYFISPVEQEKHIPHGEGMKFAAELKCELLPVFILASLYDYEKGCMVPAAVKMGFKTNDYYWASEDWPDDPSCARVVYLEIGLVYNCNKGHSYYVRPVRLSQ